MVSGIEGALERAFEKAFSKALEQTVQAKAEELFRKVMSPAAQKLQDKMGQGFQRFDKSIETRP